MKYTPENQLIWEQRINERIKSGMSVSQWCKINEISKSKYHYWNHKINKSQGSDNEIAFAEITSIISNKDESELLSSKSDDFQILFKNIQVIVPSNFNKDSLAGLMQVLQQL